MSTRLINRLEKIKRDPSLTARAVGLKYVSNQLHGFYRKRTGEHFYYIDENDIECKDEEIINRIKRLVLPPAWENVWICKSENGHLQATGIDTKGRKQYRYHSLWNSIRNQSKFYRLFRFAESLPSINKRVEHDIKQAGFTYNKILALAVCIMKETNIRIGNETYKKLYGSFGLTTLENKHVKINGTQINFKFKGKKGIYHDIELRSRRLSRMIQLCKELPGKELFQYVDSTGVKHSIDSGDVNSYLKEITGTDFTAKDFRTWAGTISAFKYFRELGIPQNATDAKKNVIKAIDSVAGHLGNTRTVCKKYYIHPAIVVSYENGNLDKYFNLPIGDIGEAGLTDDEERVKKILEDITILELTKK